MIRRPPRSTPLYSSAASDVYKRQPIELHRNRRGHAPARVGEDVHGVFTVLGLLPAGRPPLRSRLASFDPHGGRDAGQLRGATRPGGPVLEDPRRAPRGRAGGGPRVLRGPDGFPSPGGPPVIFQYGSAE